MTIKCIIIDDEPSSQSVLKHFVKDVSFLELVAVCNNAIEGLQVLKTHNTIDLLFLDINMPKISGLTFYKSLQNPPNVIFTTAYPQYAVDGFEVNAIDYLLKPFSFDRFFIAVNKVLDLKTKEQSPATDQFIMVKSNKVLHKILLNSLECIEALGDYVKLHRNDDYIITNNTFSNILKLLPEPQFVRTHKSFAVNIDLINSVAGNRISINSKTIPIGQTYKQAFLDRLEKKN
ncbi:LytR/AlgR family response regulator transcription factor [Pontimicrobium sp. MEBiC01747]